MTAEQQARDMLERIGVENAQSFPAGNLVELANLIARIAEQEAEVARLRVGHDRYETVRRMNVQQFKDAWRLNLQTGKPFDEIIDQLRPFYFASKEQP